MTKSSKRKYTAAILVILLSRIADLTLTYFYIPELDSEYNPIVSVFGASWFGLIVVQSVFLIVVVLFGYLYFSYPPIVVSEPDLNFPDFMYCYFFGTLKPWPQRIFSIPRNKGPHLILNGFLFLSVSIMISLFAIGNNLLLVMGIRWYSEYLSVWYRVYFPVVFAVIAMTSFLFFCRGQYRRYTTDTGTVR